MILLQLPLNFPVHPTSSFWLESLAIPVYCATVSAVILVLHVAFVLRPRQTATLGEEHVAITSKARRTPLFFGIVRLCGCVALVGLAFASEEREVVIRHLNTLLTVIFGTYVYRDLFPLATFNQSQRDIHEGWFLWTKFLIVTVMGVVLPLSVPPDVSKDLKESDTSASPEQTASLISLVTYTFLDPIILLANRVSHLSHDLLPPLAYYNDAKNLKATSFPHLDMSSNSKRRHVFFGLMRVFRVEYTTMMLLGTVQVATNFSSPVAINRLLDFIETKGIGAIMRPWFWILLLFVGPTVGSIATQWYKFIYNRVNIQTEAILTELVFEHSLRVRLKAETSETQKSETTGSTAPKPTNGRNLVGKINNLATTDLQNIVNAGETLPQLLVYLLQSCLGVWFLYEVLGWAAFVGLGVTMAVFPLPGYIGGRIRFVQQGLMQRTDARIQIVSETMSLLRMIKLFAWEKKTEVRISEARKDELNWLWRSNALQLSIAIAKCTVIMKQELNASKVFSSMTVFDMFRAQLHEFFATMTSLVTGRVSLDRLDNFLRETELLDAYSNDSLSSLPSVSSNYRAEIGFNNATFSWSTDDSTSSEPNQRCFLLQIDGPLFFKRNCINLIVGPTGSGKTSILMALLGEMHFMPTTSRDSWFNLPRGAGVAYAAQQSWVQNDTIRANILFGAPFDVDRYNKVIYQCGLERDLEMFEAGDLQEIGEGGVTLSGGQRARVTLARAVYSNASILLLDDVLAALDVHTAQWITEKCFAGDLLVDRTTLLVTHNIALAQPIAGFVVSVGSDGRILSQGTVSEALAKNRDLALQVIDETKTLTLQDEMTDERVNKPQVSGKLVVAEEIDVGHTHLTVKLYLSALGGQNPSFYFISLIICMFITDSLINLQTWYLGYFASQYEDHEVSQVHVAYHLSVYGGILFMTLLIYSCSYLIYLFGIVRASTIIHTQLIQSILGTTLRFLDITPTSRVIARCTQDLRDVDANIGRSLWSLMDLLFYASIRLGAIVLLAPPFLVPAVVVFMAGTWIGSLYTKAQLSVKREMSNARAPVLGHFGAAINGLGKITDHNFHFIETETVSIRAYDAQEAFINVSLKHINHYSRTARTFHNLSRWIAVRMDILGTVFITVLATYMVYFQKQGSSSIGFSLNMACTLPFKWDVLLMASSMINQLEIQSSLERINQYLKIEQEPKATINGVPPAHWPSSGSLRAENLSARYSVDGPTVLHNMSFDIKGGERVGIVGRTGSGKSSLTLALLRAILTEGAIYYDGLPMSTLNLEAVRRNITIIPQTPELLNGSLRMNLDPLGEHDDATLNGALRSAGLFSLQGETSGEGIQITLETMLASGGSNLSLGQRQVLALSRALVRGSKILILDEDYETDKVIQQSLRTELGKDVTLLVVAHRLQSIMHADRIMVLDAGKIFASPHELLANEGGTFRALVDESQDKDLLYSMASEPANAEATG
ncbi:P-loop containing nucleoside triphosphate hydrolase protein [Mycena capillaripes]|nr:P-loop containing nucleoside triphosphate hydrolase protein [Mycena capillaripes]